LKLQNIVQHSEDTNRIFLIDFGSSFSYLNDKGEHKKDKKEARYPGNLLFCSMNICRGANLSRRDDIESIIYLLIYLLSKKNQKALPWSVY
jgi:hypothetical protein